MEKLQNMRLMERDLKIFDVLDKVGYAYAGDLMLLTGFTGIVACRRRLNILHKHKYLKIDQIEGKNAYTLAARGYAEIEKINYKILEPNLGSRHMLLVGSVIAYLCDSQGVTLDHIRTDRQLRAEQYQKKGKRCHVPDTVVSANNARFAFEVELTAKDPERLKKNINANALNYDVQNWIVPDNRKKIKKNIQKIARELLLEDSVNVYSLDQILDFLYKKTYIRGKNDE